MAATRQRFSCHADQFGHTDYGQQFPDRIADRLYRASGVADSLAFDKLLASVGIDTQNIAFYFHSSSN